MSERLILISGGPAVGKTTVGDVLEDRGSKVVHADTSGLLRWGSGKEIQTGASSAWLFTHPPHYDENAKDLLRKDGRFLEGWFPGIFRFFGIATDIVWLSPEWDMKVVMERMKTRDDNPFGTTKAQMAYSLIATVTMEFAVRGIALFKKNITMLDAASNTPEQLADLIEKKFKER